MISKQLKIIICLVAAVAVLAAALAIVKSLMKDEAPDDEPFELIEGEAEGGSKKPRIIEQLAETDISEITVHNLHGDYGFVRDKDGVTVIKSLEDYPVDTEAVDALYSRLSSILVTRVDTAPEDLSAYGLDDASDPAYVVIVKTDGTSYKLKFGLPAADLSAYYIMCDGRNVVYSVNNSNIEDVLLVPVTAYISPIIAPTFEDVTYVGIEKISVKKNGSMLVAFEKVTDEYREQTGYVITHKMTYPTNYLVSISNLEKLLGSFANLFGTEVVGYGYEKFDKFGELDEYGFSDVITEVEYVYQNVPTVIYVGGKTPDGTGYYVYSLFYDTLSVVSSEALPFIDWKLGDYIGETLFQMSINYVDTIEISARGIDAKFTLSDNDTALKVLCNGRYLASDENGNAANFRMFYRHLLRVSWDGYSDIPETLGKPMLSMKITTRFGEVFDYNFYQISNLRCFFTYNGDGEFYTEKESLDKFIDNFIRVINDEEIDMNF